jgi:hypothetical protein
MLDPGRWKKLTMYGAVHTLELANVTTHDIRWNDPANELHHTICNTT